MAARATKPFTFRILSCVYTYLYNICIHVIFRYCRIDEMNNNMNGLQNGNARFFFSSGQKRKVAKYKYFRRPCDAYCFPYIILL